MVSSKSIRRVMSNDDILSEILVRLPPKSIFQVRCVSKRWNNLIMDSSFFKLCDGRRRCDGGRLLVFVQSDMVVNCIKERKFWKQACLPAVGVTSELEGVDLFPKKERGYFITSSKNGLILWGCLPPFQKAQYYVGNPITKTWLTLPPPPPVRHKTNFVSVGLTSNGEFSNGCGSNINFRVIVASRTEHRYARAGDTTMPIDTYSSKTRKWTSIELVSPKPITIEEFMPPVVSDGFFHWFTVQGCYVAYDSSLLDEADDVKGVQKQSKTKNKNTNKTKKVKEHVLQLIELPDRVGSKVIWRSDNGQTLWLGISSAKGLEIHKKYCDDEWTLVNKVDLKKNIMKNVISSEDAEKEEKARFKSNRDNNDLFADYLVRDTVWMIAFIPWDPTLVLVRFWERIFIYDWQNKTTVEVKLDRSSNYYTSHKTKWYPYFNSASLSSYTFKQLQ